MAEKLPLPALIFSLFAKYKRKKVVAKILNEKGCRTAGGAKFSDVAIARILHSPKAKAKGVPEHVLAECNRILQELKDDGKTIAKRPAHLFTGILFCHCKSPMYHSSRRSVYRCNKGCGNKISDTDLEAVFQSRIKHWLGDHQDIEVRALFAYWLQLTFEEKRRIVEELLERIMVGKDEVLFDFRG